MDEIWNAFINSGKIEDYLKYRLARTQPSGGTGLGVCRHAEADNDHGHCSA
ncbi:MAG: hypothetical protein QM689_02470 [Oscillospiraceae bacterium]